MKTIKINSSSVKGILADIAGSWNGKNSQDWDECVIRIPESWGEGLISGYGLNDGIVLLKYDCTFNEDVQLEFVEREVHPLVLNYCLSGNFEACFEHMDEFVCVEQYQSLILVNSDDEGYSVRFKNGSKVNSRSIEIDRQGFRDSFNMGDHELQDHYKDLFKSLDGEDPFYRNHMYSVVLSDYFSQIDEPRFVGLVRALRVKGLVLQILSEQLNLYEDDEKDDGVQGILRQYEISCIHEAAKIIDGELDDLVSIPQIAYRVGINANKLQDGFKLLYHNTVNGYVQEIRMKRGAYLLHYSDHTISEIVTKLGLKSKSYFSKIFREEYGITPSQYRKKKHDGIQNI